MDEELELFYAYGGKGAPTRMWGTEVEVRNVAEAAPHLIVFIADLRIGLLP